MRSSLALRAEAELELRRRQRERPGLRSVPTFREFVSRTMPSYQWYRHCEEIASVLERVVAGEINRLMVFAPPRSGKSELVSRHFPAYYLSLFPQRFVAISSYAAELAYDLSRAARRNYASGSSLSGEAAAVKHWETGQGGGLWATGVGGPATGKGASLLICDDPLKNAEEASSQVVRDRHRDWWRSVWYTRMEPGAALILIMTRWHLDDLAAWLLDEESGDEPERWTILSLPSIAEEKRPEFPASCAVLPDWRRSGEPLVPERYPIDKLRQIEARIGSYFFEALHQQRPRPHAGGMFKYDAFRIIKAIPEGVRWLSYWDTAGTDGAGDNTAGVAMGRTQEGRFVIAECVAGQWSPARKDAEVRVACERWRDKLGFRTAWLESEAGIGGAERTRSTVRALAGFDVHSERPTGKKQDRAMPLAAQVEAGNVDLVECDWNGTWTHAFRAELADFPFGKHDDRVDAASGALNKLCAVDTNAVSIQRRTWG